MSGHILLKWGTIKGWGGIDEQSLAILQRWAMSAQLGELAFAAHYRKPLGIDEVTRMAPTPEVKARPGRG